MSQRIESNRLTTCEVLEGGRVVRLGLIDRTGEPVALEFPFEQTESIVMTLPQLLSEALKARTGNGAAKYVFSLGTWSIEGAQDQKCLIVTLVTTDGFETSFGIPFDTARVLGWTLGHEGKSALDESAERSQTAAAALATVN